MRIECNILNYDSVAVKYGGKEEKIWASFVGFTDYVLSYMQFLEENVPVDGCVEVWWINGKSSILDIPFKEFDHLMKPENRFQARMAEIMKK
jgi:hypothetical protein